MLQERVEGLARFGAGVQEALEGLFSDHAPTLDIAMPWAGLTEAHAGSLVTLASVDLGELHIWQGDQGLDDLTDQGIDFYVNNHGEWDIAYLAKPYYLKVGKT